ncbi:MAG: phosphotransferase [Planctomycetes bacterium]|nr:phosphotransferase [Planctomycetota bacterium]
MPAQDRSAWIQERIEEIIGRKLLGPPRVFSDTTSYMYIDRDDLIALEDELYLVRCVEKEGRFGIDEQPKFWVKRAVALGSGGKFVLKLRCDERFIVSIAGEEILCVRSGEKESRVLEFARGDARFMQGRAICDSRGNLVRVIDFIPGETLIEHVSGRTLAHEEYFQTRFPAILAQTIDSFAAIHGLHEAGLCHGDIRNDHILVESESGRFRWIDFDLLQDSPAFDVWSLGNILHLVVAGGFLVFRELFDARPDLRALLSDEDGSMFFPHRVMNLGKVYPYLPRALCNILARFSLRPAARYDTVEQVVDDLRDCAASLG